MHESIISLPFLLHLGGVGHVALPLLREELPLVTNIRTASEQLAMITSARAPAVTVESTDNLVSSTDAQPNVKVAPRSAGGSGSAAHLISFAGNPSRSLRAEVRMLSVCEYASLFRV